MVITDTSHKSHTGFHLQRMKTIITTAQGEQYTAFFPS